AAARRSGSGFPAARVGSATPAADISLTCPRVGSTGLAITIRPDQAERGAASRVPPTRRRSFPEGPSLGASPRHADNPRLFLNGANSALALRGLRECDVRAVLDLRHRRLPSARAFRVLCPQGARNVPCVPDRLRLGIRV